MFYPYSSQYNKFFNWTISYRQDADFRNQYGKLTKIEPHSSQEDELKKQIKLFGINHLAISQNKTKKIAWFVSHCNTKSQREKYVKELEKHIEVCINLV